jgi:hypothetical protein
MGLNAERDGTFAWWVEGGLFIENYPDKNGWISPMLKSFYYYGERNYNKTATSEQAVWVGVIVSMLGVIFIKKHEMNNKVAALMLSILGLTTFELLFESRARYLHIYTPIYICLSILGLKNMVYEVAKLKQSICLKFKTKK